MVITAHPMKTATPATHSPTPFEIAVQLADTISNLDLDSVTKERVAMTNLIRDAITEDRRNSHQALVEALEETAKALQSAMDRLESARMRGDAATYAPAYHQARAALSAVKGVQS